MALRLSAKSWAKAVIALVPAAIVVAGAKLVPSQVGSALVSAGRLFDRLCGLAAVVMSQGPKSVVVSSRSSVAANLPTPVLFGPAPRWPRSRSPFPASAPALDRAY